MNLIIHRRDAEVTENAQRKTEIGALLEKGSLDRPSYKAPDSFRNRTVMLMRVPGPAQYLGI